MRKVTTTCSGIRVADLQPIGERPAIDAKVRNARDVRGALERRFAAGFQDGVRDGEGTLTSEIADRAAKALLDGDKAAWELARSAIHEINGPPRQGIDVKAQVFSVVRIVGEDFEDEAE